MPYQRSNRLPGERASRLGHLEVLNSALVNELCQKFDSDTHSHDNSDLPWEIPNVRAPHLPLVFGIDGSIQTVRRESPPYREIAFVKTALLRLDESALARVDRGSPHPFVLRDILKSSAIYHATVFPLRHIAFSNMTIYDAIRRIIFESMADASLDGHPLETLKWIVYEKWRYEETRKSEDKKSLPDFECPHCEGPTTLPYDAEYGPCIQCKQHVYVTDMLGFHLDMTMDAASDSVPMAYMNIHELLLLFTGIRYFWQHKRSLLSSCLFVKDGPLSIRAQYSKLVAPIRRLLARSAEAGTPIHIIGQEKTGRFFDHLQRIGNSAPDKSIFIPGNNYIKGEIQNRPDRGAAYGKDTNYGAKVFVKLNPYHKMVLNIPTTGAQYISDPGYNDLIGADRILATLPRILSNRFEGALLPIELAHGIASLSTYPSARVLQIFAEAKNSK